MKRIKRKKKNNFGFSLVELVVSVAILSIVSAAIFEFVILASRHYQRETREVGVQYEAQLSVNQLQDLIIDATRGIAYSVNGSTDKVLTDDDITVDNISTKQIMVFNENKYYIVKWDAAQAKLLYSEYVLEETTHTWLSVTTDALMAEYVEQFSADLSETEGNGSVRLEVLFSNERKYTVTQSVTLRNKVLINAEMNEMYSY